MDETYNRLADQLEAAGDNEWLKQLIIAKMYQLNCGAQWPWRDPITY